MPSSRTTSEAITSLSWSMKRYQWIITGGVQGVGFRPFVYKTALDFGITGHIANTPQGVVIEIQGHQNTLLAFEKVFTHNLPPLAHILEWNKIPLHIQAKEKNFCILPSTSGHGHHVLISPDVGTCPDCLKDMSDPLNRRHRYVFTNCTNCGPRYTITRSIPYDRATTSMSCFPLCSECQHEYTNPLNRRFHAQPNACPICGPKLWLTDNMGQKVLENDCAMQETARLLHTGKILALKGLGGFHLCCDARNPEAVRLLRQRKNRQDKPLAIMVRDVATARTLCQLTPGEEELLLSWQRPIVLAHTRSQNGLAPGISPDTNYLGLMLPYTPLHHVLFHDLAQRYQEPPALVMTSGNISSEPISLGNREALRRLQHIADFFLLHDRDILIRCDDSVVRVLDNTPLFLRRARGFTPSPIDMAQKGPCVLGVGPLLKNTICLTKDNQAFVSQHIGDLENLESYTFFKEIINHLTDILQVTPQAIVHDLHPDFLSTQYALTSGLPCWSLQHHFAHIHAVLAENQYRGPAIGLALDGTGLGTDETIWGGEALYVDSNTLTHQRLARFSHLPLPGGDMATREPWRLARAALYTLGIHEPSAKIWPWLDTYKNADTLVGQMLVKNLNTPLSSSCGRIFDAVAAMLGLCSSISYEGQAAIKLEAIQDKSERKSYHCPILEHDDYLELDTLHLFAQVHDQWQKNICPAKISRRFHLGLISGLVQLGLALAQKHSCETIALSGGVMHNMTMAHHLETRLTGLGLKVLTHKKLPPNDACISLGQAAYGQRLLELHKEQ